MYFISLSRDGKSPKSAYMYLFINYRKALSKPKLQCHLLFNRTEDSLCHVYSLAKAGYGED